MTMSDERLQYLLDRIEIQDKAALYGLGQDLHQADSGNGNVLAQWKDLFVPDVSIDITAAGGAVLNLQQYAEMMRGTGLVGGTEGIGRLFDAWQHIEGHATVSIDGDSAHSITPHLHTHAHRDRSAHTVVAGYWHDDWLRTPQGWRIRLRRLEHLYAQTFPTIPTPSIAEGVDLA